MWLLLAQPQLGTWTTAQACALTGNRTRSLLVRRPVLSPLSHTSQGHFLIYILLLTIPQSRQLLCNLTVELKRNLIHYFRFHSFRHRHIFSSCKTKTLGPLEFREKCPYFMISDKWDILLFMLHISVLLCTSLSVNNLHLKLSHSVK